MDQHTLYLNCKSQDKLFFENISLLITHYNRSNSLERLLRTFRELNCYFKEIIVSDDCSNDVHFSHVQKLKEQYGFRLIETKTNKGLANNLNKGDDAVLTPLTLYVQEDFIPKVKFREKLQLASDFMVERPELDLIRFYAYFDYPYLKVFKGGFYEMIFYKLTINYRKFYYYSDHPHLRRRNFLEKFGRFTEGIKSDQAEYKMMQSFVRSKGKGLFYKNFKELFDQENDSHEPSTVKRNFLRENNSFLLSNIRHVYRFLKFHFDLFS